jgi:hypothetical protein
MVIKSWRMRWAEDVVHMEEMINAYSILAGKPEWKRPLRRYRYRWEDNTGMDLRQIRWEGVNWMDLAQDSDPWQALVNMVMNFQVP